MGVVNRKHRSLLSGVRTTRIQGLTRSYAIKMARRSFFYLVVFLGIVTVSMLLVFGIADWRSGVQILGSPPLPHGDPIRRGFIYGLIGLLTIPAAAAALRAVWLIRPPRVRMAGYALVILVAAVVMASAIHFFRSDKTWCSTESGWMDCLDVPRPFELPYF